MLARRAVRRLVVRQLDALGRRGERDLGRSLAWCWPLLLCSCRDVGMEVGVGEGRSRRGVVGAGRMLFVGCVEVDPFAEEVLGGDLDVGFGRVSCAAIRVVDMATDVVEVGGSIGTFLVGNDRDMVV